MNFNKLSKSVLVGVLSAGVLAGPMIAAPASAVEPQVKAVTSATVNNNSELYSPLPKGSYRLTSYFGERCTTSVGAGFWHNAVDLAANDGTPIYSIADGVVESFQGTSNGRTGVVTVNHGTYKGKKLVASYAHMWDPTKYVKVGQKVKKGQQISEVGSSGISSGPHIHFVINHGGVEIDPLPFMKEAGVDFTKEATYVRPKPATPSSCDMYTWASVGLKEKPVTTSKTIAVIDRGSKVIGYTGKSNNGYYKVKDVKTGKIGYMYAETLGANSPGARPSAKTSSMAQNVPYTAMGTWHFRDYPSVTIGEGGILDTIQKGEFFTTTGKKTSNNGWTWYEVKFDGKTGWVPNHGIIEAPNSVTGTTSTLKNATYTPRNSVNIRNYPDSSSKIYTTYLNLKTGAKMVSTGRMKNNFIEVKYNNRTYWAPKDYVKQIASNLPATSSMTKNIEYKAKANGTQIRNYPSTNSAQGWNLKTINKNSSVKSTGRKSGNWIEVTSGSTKGWVDQGKFNRQIAKLPKTTSVTKNISYKAKSNISIRNYPSTNEVQGWNILNIKKNAVVKTTGKKAGSWIEVTSGKTKGWVNSSNFNRQVATLPKLANTSKNHYYAVNVTSLQMRNYPSTSEAQGWNVKKLNRNSKIITTGKKYGSWLQVKSGSTTGWVQSKQVKRTTANFPKLKSTTKNATYKAKSNQSVMNYPSSSSSNGWRIATVKKNATVKTTGRINGSFIEVTSGKTKGWVNKNYFNLSVGKTESVKNYKLKRNLSFTSSYNGGKKTTIKKGKTVKTTGWAYGSKVEVIYGKKKYWIYKSSL